jgi:hypothetical protein
MHLPATCRAGCLRGTCNQPGECNCNPRWTGVLCNQCTAGWTSNSTNCSQGWTALHFGFSLHRFQLFVEPALMVAATTLASAFVTLGFMEPPVRTAQPYARLLRTAALESARTAMLLQRAHSLMELFATDVPLDTLLWVPNHVLTSKVTCVASALSHAAMAGLAPTVRLVWPLLHDYRSYFCS